MPQARILWVAALWTPVALQCKPGDVLREKFGVEVRAEAPDLPEAWIPQAADPIWVSAVEGSLLRVAQGRGVSRCLLVVEVVCRLGWPSDGLGGGVGSRRKSYSACDQSSMVAPTGIVPLL